MKRLILLGLTLALVAATSFGDDFILNQDVAQDHNGNRVRLNATKNADGTYSLNIAGVTLQAGDITVNGGDASAANQTTEISKLASIDGKTPALVGGSVPVTGSLNIANFPGTQPVSGTVAATQSGTWTVQPGNTANTTPWKVDASAATVPVSGTFWQATQPVSIATMPTTPVTGTFWPATQPVSGTVTASAPTGTRVNSNAYEASHVLKNAAGTLISLTGYNSGPSQFILLFDSATVPANGATAVKVLFVSAQSNFSSDVPITGLPFSTGIAVSNSSTAPTKTIASTDVFFTAVVQ